MSNLKDFEVTQDESKCWCCIITHVQLQIVLIVQPVVYISGLKKLPKDPRVVFTGCGVWTKGENLLKKIKVDSLLDTLKKKKSMSFY